MPIYEFHCEDCERDSEILLRSSRWQGTKCPRCGSAKLSKKFSTFAASVASTPGCATPACDVSTSGACGGCCGGGPHRH